MAEADVQVGILIGDIDAAGVGPDTIDDSDLPVIPIVEIDSVYITMHRIEHLHLDTGTLHLLQGIIRQAGEIAKVVKNDADFHTGRGPLLQHLKYFIPDLSLGQDIILHKDIDFCLLQMLDQIPEKVTAVSEILGAAVPV